MLEAFPETMPQGVEAFPEAAFPGELEASPENQELFPEGLEPLPEGLETFPEGMEALSEGGDEGDAGSSWLSSPCPQSMWASSQMAEQHSPQPAGKFQVGGAGQRADELCRGQG